MNRQAATQTHQQKPTATPAASGVLQRKCACGNHTMAGGECEECSKKTRLGLQTKLQVNEPGDSYEQEADRIADHVMATSTHLAVSGAPPRIQRFSGQTNVQMDVTPASVDRAMVSPGRPLEPALRQDMEQRFGYDFSRVRVHSGAAAEQSARDVNAHAYTAGQNIVFGAGRFAPGAQDGRRLLAHELTHVAQQGGEGDLIQRAPANYPSNDPIAAQIGPKPDSSAKKSKPQLTPDDWIWMLENFRRKSSQEFVKFLAVNEGFFYPILNPYGFRGSWTKDQAYLDDFDAAIVKWGKSQIYSLRFANISQTVSQQKPKSREEQKYEYAQYLVRDMNRHGYTRGKVNDELESYGLMDDLVSHGFERHDKWSFKNHEEYTNEAVVALNDYIDRYDAAHGNKRQTSANVPTQGEDVEFYRAWLEGLNYVTGSFFGAAFAATASKFTSDPKKITAAAGLGVAFEGVVFSMAGALGGGGRYRPEVVGPRDRPAAVAPWRYTGKQPIKPVADPAKVGARPAPDRIPTPDPVVKDPAPSPAPTPAIEKTLGALGVAEGEGAQLPTGVKVWGEITRGKAKLVTYLKLQGNKLTAGVLSSELPKIAGKTVAQVATEESGNVINAYLAFRRQSMTLAKQLGADTLRLEADVVINPDLPESLRKAGFKPIPNSPGSYSKEEPVK
jgi:hypothetical protein